MKMIFRNLSELYWGADFHLLKFDKIETSRFIRYEVIIILLSYLTFLSTNKSILCGIVVFFTYKWFLSNLNLIITTNNTKKYIKLILSITIGIGISCGLFIQTGANSLWNGFDIDSLILLIVILVMVLFLCYIPIRFTPPTDGIYAKLFRERTMQDESNAKLIQQSEFEAQKEQINQRLMYDKQQKATFVEQMNKEILQTRIRLAKEVLAKWEESQKKTIEQNWQKYIAD